MFYVHDLDSGRVNGCFWRKADIRRNGEVVPIATLGQKFFIRSAQLNSLAMSKAHGIVARSARAKRFQLAVSLLPMGGKLGRVKVIEFAVGGDFKSVFPNARRSDKVLIC